jgi:hypothetical protein
LRELAKNSCSQAPFWSETHSHSYGLSAEQACEHEDEPEPRLDKGGNSVSSLHTVIMLNIVHWHQVLAKQPLAAR